MKQVLLLLVYCLLSQLCYAQKSAAIEKSDQQQLDFFEKSILPILEERCYQCHSRQALAVEGGLLLDSRAGILSGGDSGPAVVPGNVGQSLLWKAITSKDNPMPPDERLDPRTIENFRLWIASGAVDSRDAAVDPPLPKPDYTEAKQYWAFQPVKSPEVPTVNGDAWCATPIDCFILQKLEHNGLVPAPAADPEILLRRLTFDLTGFPPSPEQVDAFVANPTEDSYLAVVDRLLASPHYGERQAQHWLDVIRYAETEGFEYDRLMPGIWRYRDYVVDSLNADKPYDQFLVEQIAGDELAPGNHEMRIAAGFHRLGAVRRNAGNQLVASSRNEVLTERTDIVGTVVLGLTVGCARCHDHKFDPIAQRDYYCMQAYFAASEEENISLRQGEEHERLMALTASLEAQIAELKETLSGLSGEDELRVRSEIAKLESQVPPIGPLICSIKNDFENFSPVQLLRRGDPELPGATVGMRAPAVLAPRDAPELLPNTAQPRTILARELTDPRHPLTARVMANRIWLQHFGNGLVSTPNDFGKNGSRPSHPELLDYLANTFVNGGWRLKALHREIVTSSVYRQSSNYRNVTPAREVDPTNRWLSHFSRRRLSGEEIRDAMLCVADALNTQLGGESVLLPVEQELVDQLYKPSQWEVSKSETHHSRRSIYLLAKRNLRLPFLEVFDQPSSQTSCAVREQSTHARQALELLNGPIANKLAAALAKRLAVEASDDVDAIIHRAYRLTTARVPSAQELDICRHLVAENGLDEFSLAMYNLNAFLYVD